MNIELIAAPLIGGVIGLVTNGIAIRMLFRPFYPVKIGKYTLPFTPGLIPKEKPRLARAIGAVIGKDLLDTDTLQKALASEDIRQALNRRTDQIIEDLGQEDRTVYELLKSRGFAEPADAAAAYVGKSVSQYVTDSLIERGIGEEILEYAVTQVIANLNAMVAMVAEPAIRKAQPMIAEKVNEIIREEGPELLENYIGKEYRAWMDKPVKEAGTILWQKKEMMKEKLWEAYVGLLNKKSARFLERLDISAIVEQKINEFDVQYLEKLIMEISRKELNALVWMGGILGMLIGFVNLLF